MKQGLSTEWPRFLSRGGGGGEVLPTLNYATGPFSIYTSFETSVSKKSIPKLSGSWNETWERGRNQLLEENEGLA